MIYPFSAAANRQFVGGTCYEYMGSIVTRSCFIEISILNRRHARAHSVVAVAVVNGLRERIERIQDQTLRVALLKLHSSGVVSGVPRIRHVVDGAKLRIRQIILRSRKRCRPKCRIVRTKAGGKYVIVPALHKVNARRTLIRELDDVVCT